jgi:hypothetical protein
MSKQDVARGLKNEHRQPCSNPAADKSRCEDQHEEGDPRGQHSAHDNRVLVLVSLRHDLALQPTHPEDDLLWR